MSRITRWRNKRAERAVWRQAELIVRDAETAMLQAQIDRIRRVNAELGSAIAALKRANATECPRPTSR